jgi:class 3 adenylate cyclase
MAESEAPHVRGFLFADLRGYTQFVEKHGDKAASELLSAYRAVVRAAVAEFRGAEIRTEGESFMSPLGRVGRVHPLGCGATPEWSRLP